MSFSSGVFSLSAGNPVVTGTTISSTTHNNTESDIATGLSTCVLKDGTQTITANIPMSSYKFTGLAAGSAAGNSVRYEQFFPGTSGGIPYYSATGTIASSAALAASAIVLGGGAGTTPATTTTGTGVVTALGVNVGSAGAFVTFNGAGGTPSSLTLANATGLPIGGITMNTARLLGRTTASAGAAEEITVGTGLSLAAGSLTATAGTAPVFGRVVRTAGDITTTSTSLVDVTGATVTFTTGAFPCAVGCAMTAYTSAGNTLNFNIMVDAALELGTAGTPTGAQTASTNFSFSHQTAALTAASHTIKMQWSIGAGTGTITAGSAVAFSFWAHEIR